MKKFVVEFVYNSLSSSECEEKKKSIIISFADIYCINNDNIKKACSKTLTENEFLCESFDRVISIKQII